MDRSSNPAAPNLDHVRTCVYYSLVYVQFFTSFFHLCFFFEISLGTISLSQLGSACEVGSYSNRSAGSLFDGAINEATPSQRPVGACEYDVTLSCSHIFQMRGYQAWCWEKPTAKIAVRNGLDSKKRGERKDAVLTKLPWRTHPWTSCGRPSLH